MKRFGKDETGFSSILGMEEKDRINSVQSSLKSYPLWVALYVIKSINIQGVSLQPISKISVVEKHPV